jgi:hypothetical protein
MMVLALPAYVWKERTLAAAEPRGGPRMRRHRTAHSTTVLQDGRVLVAGGYDGRRLFASAEVYDPAPATWSTTGDMIEPRHGHTATLLADGRVLVAGGSLERTACMAHHSLRSAELYDPTSGTWTATGSMNASRCGHAAALLPDGQVLVTGGVGLMAGAALPEEEPLPAQFREEAIAALMPMIEERVRRHRALEHPVRVSAEMYDPATGTWNAVAPVPRPRDGHWSFPLSDSRVMVFGGGPWSSNDDRSGDIYDAATDTWQSIPSIPPIPPDTRASGSPVWAGVLPDGRLLVIIDFALADIAFYDPGADLWTVGRVPGPGIHTASPQGVVAFALLTGGRVLAAGGYRLDTWRLSTADAALFDPATGSWTATGAMMVGRQEHSTVTLPSGQVLAFGGKLERRDTTPFTVFRQLTTSEIYDPASGTWSAGGR